MSDSDDCHIIDHVVPGSEKWDEALSRAYGTWDRTGRTGGFSASLRLKATKGLQIINATCDPCSARRSQTLVRRDEREYFALIFTKDGQEQMSVGERRLVLAPGDVFVTNSLLPAAYDVILPMEKTSVLIPIGLASSWLPRVNRLSGRLAASAESTRILRGYIDLIAPAFIAGSISNGYALTESIMGLLVAILNDDHPRTLHDSHFRGVRAFIEDHLSDPTLNLTMIAASQGISLRYLHALFDKEDTTVRRYIYQRRLLRCASDLENPVMVHRSISDIGFSWGFENISHFSRRFKEEFGMSPTAYRRASTRAALTRP